MMVKTKIPEGWEEKEIRAVGRVVTGKTPSTFNDLFWNGEIPFVTPTDIIEKRIQDKTERTVTELGIKQSTEIPAGCLMVTCIASIGKNAISKRRCCTNQQINTIIPNKDAVVNYLYYFIEFKKQNLEMLAGKTAVPIINKNEFEKYKIIIPQFVPEQQMISDIILTIDNAIDKTKELIEKNKKIKQGLMSGFFEKNKGLNEDFLGNNAKITMGQSPASKDCNEEGIGIPFLQGNADFGNPYPLPKLYCVSPTKLAHKGEILISVRAPVGDINLADQDYCIGRGLSSISAKGNLVQIFLYYCLIYFRFQLSRVMQGTTFEAVNSEDLFKVKIRFPEDKTEQIHIATILSSIDNKIQSEENYLKKLVQMKSGLMQDLLTGERRVNLEAS